MRKDTSLPFALLRSRAKCVKALLTRRSEPAGVEELLLADEAATVLDEVEQQAERLWLQGHGNAVRNQVI